MKKGITRGISNKKAISAIVATVLIILITVAAVSIIWAVIIPLIQNNLVFEEGQVDLRVETIEGYTVYDPETMLMTLQVRRGVDDLTLNGIQFLFSREGNSFTTFRKEVPMPNQAITYRFNLTEIGGAPSSVKVAPVFANGELGQATSVEKVSTGNLSNIGGVFPGLDEGSETGGILYYYLDADGDGWGNETQLTEFPGNVPSGYVTKKGDCNDNNVSRWKILQGYLDTDKDGYGAGASLSVCSGNSLPTGYSNITGDCNNNNAAIKPGVAEICSNGVDDNCNGQLDEGCDCEDFYNAGETSNGIYNICPTSNICIDVYCNMDLGGSASIFTLDDSYIDIHDEQCVFNQYGDDHDSVILWTDLSLKMGGSYGTYNPSQDYFWTLDRGLYEDWSFNQLPDVPYSGIGYNARPVPLPGSQKTIWFDGDSSSVVWFDDSWNEVTKSFYDLGFDSNCPAMQDGYNNYNYYAVSDGVSMINIGSQYDSSWNYAECNYLLKFDFINNDVYAESGNRLYPTDLDGNENWFYTEEDGFGHILYTVNGRVMYYSGFDGYSSAYFTLGGGMRDLNEYSDVYSAPRYYNDPWGNYYSPWNDQAGLDLFGVVDYGGDLWFADYGHDDGGYFSCGDDEALGIGRTNIRLTY